MHERYPGQGITPGHHIRDLHQDPLLQGAVHTNNFYFCMIQEGSFKDLGHRIGIWTACIKAFRGLPHFPHSGVTAGIAELQESPVNSGI
ncbi:unnamed protein product [Caretta caretta]